MEDSRNINTDSNLKKLMSEFQTLSTFAGVMDWGKKAGDEIERIAGIIRALDIEIARDAHELERIRYEQAKKPLVGRLFNKGSGEEKDIEQRIEQRRQEKTALEKETLQLQEAIDFTPKSADEKKVLMNELRQHKRQLQEKRREITTVIRGPRTELQQAPEPGFDAAAAKRRKARYARDSELREQEKSKDAMDRQLSQIDSDLLWVEKFN